MIHVFIGIITGIVFALYIRHRYLLCISIPGKSLFFRVSIVLLWIFPVSIFIKNIDDKKTNTFLIILMMLFILYIFFPVS